MREKYKIVLLALCMVCGLLCGCRENQEGAKIEKVIPWEMGFLAVGDKGQIVEISSDGAVSEIESGTKADFKDIWSDGDSVWIIGERGTLLSSNSSLAFEKENTECEKKLNAGACYNGKLYCGGEDGLVICSPGDGIWESCSIMIKGNVVGIAVSDSRCLLVTDVGEAAVTEDGNSWTVLRYNEYYQKEVEFQGLIYDGNSFWAYGNTQEGTTLFYTDSGSAWAERDINYLEGEDVDLSGLQILSVTSDGQQLYAWCDGGELLTIPGCVKCNKKTSVDGIGAGAVGYHGGKLLVAEDARHVKVIDTEIAKQYQVSADTAYQRQQEGAVLIDVRDEEEHADKCIKGSVCIPLDRLAEELPVQYPDQGQTIIFYCTKGIRSQSAVEKAVELGYVEVYSLGSIDNWSYEFE